MEVKTIINTAWLSELKPCTLNTTAIFFYFSHELNSAFLTAVHLCIKKMMS